LSEGGSPPSWRMPVILHYHILTSQNYACRGASSLHRLLWLCQPRAWRAYRLIYDVIILSTRLPRRCHFCIFIKNHPLQRWGSYQKLSLIAQFSSHLIPLFFLFENFFGRVQSPLRLTGGPGRASTRIHVTHRPESSGKASSGPTSLRIAAKSHPHSCSSLRWKVQDLVLWVLHIFFSVVFPRRERMKKRGAIGWSGRTREKSIGLDNSFASACFLTPFWPFFGARRFQSSVVSLYLVAIRSKTSFLLGYLLCKSSILH